MNVRLTSSRVPGPTVMPDVFDGQILLRINIAMQLYLPSVYCLLFSCHHQEIKDCFI